MKRRLFIERLITTAACCVVGHPLLEMRRLALPQRLPDEAGSYSIEGMVLKYPGDGVTLEGYLSRPRRSGASPGAILLHGNGGLNHDVRHAAEQLSRRGYATLVPDLLSRQGGTLSFATPDHVATAFARVQINHLNRDLKSAYRFMAWNDWIESESIFFMKFRSDSPGALTEL